MSTGNIPFSFVLMRITFQVQEFLSGIYTVVRKGILWDQLPWWRLAVSRCI